MALLPRVVAPQPQSTRGETTAQSQIKYRMGILTGVVPAPTPPSGDVVVEKPVVIHTRLPGGGQQYSLGKEVTTYSGLTPVEKLNKQSMTSDEQARREANARLFQRQPASEALAERRQEQIKQEDYTYSTTTTTSATPGNKLEDISMRSSNLIAAGEEYYKNEKNPFLLGALGITHGVVGTVGGLASVGSKVLKGDVGGAAKDVLWEGPKALVEEGISFVAAPSVYKGTKLIGEIGMGVILTKGGGAGVKGVKSGVAFGKKVISPGKSGGYSLKIPALTNEPPLPITPVYKTKGSLPTRPSTYIRELRPPEEFTPNKVTTAAKSGPRVIDIRTKGYSQMKRGYTNPFQTQELLERGGSKLIDVSKETGTRVLREVKTGRISSRFLVGTALVAGQGAIQAQKSRNIFEQKRTPTEGQRITQTPASSSVFKSSEIIAPVIVTSVITSSFLIQGPGEQTSYRYREETQPERPKQPEYKLLPGPGGNTGENRWFGKGRKSLFGRKTKYAPSTLGKLMRFKATTAQKRKPLFTGLEVRGI